MMDRPGRIALPDDGDDDLERQAVNANSHNIAASANDYADDFDISENEDVEVGTASKTAPGENTPGNSTATPVANGADDDDDDDTNSAKKNAGKIFGMENFGNTCYCNSVIQCLYYSKPFREHVLNFPASPDTNDHPRRTTVSGIHPHPFTVDPASAKISTSTGNAEAVHVQTQAALHIAHQVKSNGYDHSSIIGNGNNNSSGGQNESKKSASESKSLGRRMSLFGKSSKNSSQAAINTTNGNGPNNNNNTSSDTNSNPSSEKLHEQVNDAQDNDGQSKLADAMSNIFDSNNQTSYLTSKLLYPGLSGIVLGVRYPGQNIPVVGFTEDPFATQETRKRSALVKGPIINLDLSYSDTYKMKESLFTTLKDIFECMAENQSRIGVVSPAKLIEVLKRENELFRSSMHQDAHEFLNFLLNEVIENIDRQNRLIGSSDTGVTVNAMPKPSASTTPTGARWVHDLFEGLLTSETKCLTCETVSRRDEQFLDLSLDIERNSSVTACLRQFSASEMLCERNKFNCDHCGGLHEAEKRMKVKKLPKILALHLKRFKYTEDLQRNVKLFHRVVYPRHLRLDNTTHDAQDKDKLYELYAVVVHIGGGPYHGHYVSVVKTETAGWLLFDDEMVEGVDPTYVFNFFGDNKGLATAYVLFYQETTQEQLERENLYTNCAPMGANGTTVFNTPAATATPSVNPSTIGLSSYTNPNSISNTNAPPSSVASPMPVSAIPSTTHLDAHSSYSDRSDSAPIPLSHSSQILSQLAGSVSPKASGSLAPPKRTKTNENGLVDPFEDPPSSLNHLPPIEDTHEQAAEVVTKSPQKPSPTSYPSTTSVGGGSGPAKFKSSSSNRKSFGGFSNARITHDPAATTNSNSSNSSSTAAPREIIDRLRGFLLFSTAPEPFLEAIASRLVPQVYPARTFIITEGEEARAMYWIIKGTVAIVSRDGEAIHAELGPGAFFGEIGILFDCPRTASVQARERCVIAVLTAGAVNEVLPGFPQVETIIRNEAQERLAVLAKNRQQQQTLRRNSTINPNKTNTAPDGTTIESSAANSKSDAAVTTTATAADQSSKEHLPAQQRRDLGKYLEHTGIREVLAEMPLFQQLPDSIIHRLALSVEPISYGPFQMIIEHDTVGKDIYFIIDGQVEVLDDTSGTVMARLTRGSYFGEMAFLRLAERRTASVRTITECDCLVVTEATLDSLCEDFPEVHSHIEDTAKARLDTNQQLSAGTISNGASSIYLNKRHNSVSSASDHSSSSSARDDDAVQQGKPLDHDPFRVHPKGSKISGDSTDSHGMRAEKDDNGVELFSKSWNTTGSFDGSLTLLRPPPPDIEPHEPAAMASSDGPAGMSPADSAVDMSSFQFDPMGLAQADTSLPASPHTLPDLTAASMLNGLTPTINNNHINNNNNNNNNINNNTYNSNNSFSPSVGQRNEFRKQPSPGVSISSPSSSRHSSRSSFGGFNSIPEEDESGATGGANGNGGVALAKSPYHQQQQTTTTYKRPLPGILLHPRAKRVRQNSRRRSSLFNVGPFPDFIQIKIFQYLDLRTLMGMQRVCQHWYQILQTSQQLLRELDLRPYNTTINDTTIVPITNFAGLRPKVVDISHCFHLTDEGFSYLVNGIGLAKIHVFRMKSVWEVSSMAIMDLTVPSIGAELEEIDLSNCRKVSDSTLTRLIGWVVPPDSYGGFPGGDPTAAPVVVGCAKLRKISLSYCKHITDRSLYHMAMFAADRIESLDLTRCTTITDHGFSFWNFRPFSALRHLCLADCTFLTDKAIMTIAAAAKGLESLVLSFCCALTDLAVEVLALGCPRLRVLEMQYCGSAVSDMSLAAVAHHLHALERLSVRGCVRVTAPGVNALVAVSQSLLYLDITQCRNVAERIVAPRAGLFIKQ
ncbi:hypothetical protein D0Z00_001942 [Geotrichum galactomycetum]|uniref:Uncharacterized protein n=1 Tax=Geotrichum galactomycetum TaxID=27317 RepID=A0ACB6V5Q6_9ASCO|nr:hypothetical protein D0Z00_001942 [Geotrichum candidum]